MKDLNIFGALFLALLLMKGTETPFFGEVPTWWEVWAPFALNLIVKIIEAWIKASGIWKRFEFWLWYRPIKKQLDKIGKAEAKAAGSAGFQYYDGGATNNPGKFQDPENFGK